MGTVGAFAAMTSLFGTPEIAAILIIEVSAIGGPRLRLLPGLLGAEVGMLVTLGYGSWQGLGTGDYAFSVLCRLIVNPMIDRGPTPGTQPHKHAATRTFLHEATTTPTRRSLMNQRGLFTPRGIARR